MGIADCQYIYDALTIIGQQRHWIFFNKVFKNLGYHCVFEEIMELKTMM